MLPSWGRTVSQSPVVSSSRASAREQPGHPGSRPPGQPRQVMGELGFFGSAPELSAGVAPAWSSLRQGSPMPVTDVLPVPSVSGVNPS